MMFISRKSTQTTLRIVRNFANIFPLPHSRSVFGQRLMIIVLLKLLEVLCLSCDQASRNEKRFVFEAFESTAMTGQKLNMRQKIKEGEIIETLEC